MDIVRFVTKPVRTGPEFRRAKWRATVFAYLVVGTVILMLLTLYLVPPGAGMPWEWDWDEVSEFAGNLLSRAAAKFEWWQLAVLAAPLIFVPFARMVERQELEVTGDRISFRSGLPDWLQSLSADWAVRRAQVTRIELLDLQRNHPNGYQWVIRTQDGDKRIPAFGWYEKEKVAETFAMPTGRFFSARAIAAAAREGPVARTFTAFGYPVVEVPLSEQDNLRKSKVAIAVVVIALVCVGIGLAEQLFLRPYAHFDPLPWVLLSIGIAIVGGLVVSMLLRERGLRKEEHLGASFAFAACFGLLVWAGLPHLNALPGGSGFELEYRYLGEGEFTPVEGDAPPVRLRSRAEVMAAWSNGDRLSLRVWRGVLGIWQYDHRAARAALANGPADAD